MTEFEFLILVTVPIATSVTDLVYECCFTSLAYFPIWGIMIAYKLLRELRLTGAVELLKGF